LTQQAHWLTVRHGIGSALVVLQFALIAVLAWLALPVLRSGAAPALAWVLWIAAAALGVGALRANRPGNFNIRPTPRAGGALVDHGPYRWIRHPMYTSLMGAAAGCVVMAPSVASVAAALALAAVLLTKAHLEERWMTEHHAAYAAYRARTKRFVPYLF
jgi:protein-S-isoprenylcysteine O-methyltransferase Ste14